MRLNRNGGAAETLDVVFPVLHGTYGEDGTAQQQLEKLKEIGSCQEFECVHYRANGTPLSILAAYEMYLVLAVGGLTTLEAVILVLL